MKIDLHENIKKYRKEMGLTQEDLAEAFNVTVGAVSKWESGTTIPDIFTLMELADFFSTSVDVLLGYSQSSKSIDDITDKIDDLFQEGRYDEVISECDKALVRYPGNFKMLARCAQTYQLLSTVHGTAEYRNKAIELYEEALRYTSQSKDKEMHEFTIRLWIAELKAHDNPEESLKEFERINFMGVADVNIARLLMKSGKLDESLARHTRTLVSILVRCTEFSSTMALALIKSGKKKDYREACDLMDWCITIFDATSTGKISYLTKMKVALLMIKAMCLSCLKETESMKKCIDDAYELAKEYDRDPANNFSDRIKFWHAGKDFQPSVYDELGRSAVESIESIINDDPDFRLDEATLLKMADVKEYWDSIKELTEET